LPFERQSHSQAVQSSVRAFLGFFELELKGGTAGKGEQKPLGPTMGDTGEMCPMLKFTLFLSLGVGSPGAPCVLFAVSVLVTPFSTIRPPISRPPNILEELIKLRIGCALGI
jgi:hypothetical protein